jgi:hypothetical protein
MKKMSVRMYLEPFQATMRPTQRPMVVADEDVVEVMGSSDGVLPFQQMA